MAKRVVRPIAIDLFAGAGGLSLGVEQAGFDVTVAVEYDPIHAMTHKFNFPDCAVLCRDVQKLTGADLIAAVHAARPSTSSLDRPVTLLVGGPSCQGFSTIGARQPGDLRNQLLLDFVRIVTEVRPIAFIMENVAGLLEPRFDQLRELAWKHLRAAGYSLAGTDQWVDAYDFGVPQRRRRVVVTGRLDGASIDLHSPVATGLTVGDAFDGLPIIESYAALETVDCTHLTAADRERRTASATPYARALAGLDANPGDFSMRRVWEQDMVTNALRTQHAATTIARFQETPQGKVDSGSRLFRLDPMRASRTLRAGSAADHGSHTSPRPIHPTLPRVITVREAARLHGYPDWFRFNATNWHGHRQVGNSVPPPLARAAATAVLEALGVEPTRPTRVIALGDERWLQMKPKAAGAELGVRSDELPAPRTRKG